MTRFLHRVYRYFFNPGDLLRIKTLDVTGYAEPCVVMEEAIFQCLENFFDKNQPLHILTGEPYEKGSISVERQLELLKRVHEIKEPDYESNDDYMVLQILLDILDWWRKGGSKNILDTGVNVFNHMLDATGQIELALAAEHAVITDSRARVEYVFKHRERLWT